MEDGLIQKLVEFIEQASPIVWQAAYRQSYILAIHEILFGLLFAVGGYFSLRGLLTNRRKSREQRDRYGPDYDIAASICLILLITCILLSSIFFIVSTGPLLNPEYYAIERLLVLVR